MDLTVIESGTVLRFVYKNWEGKVSLRLVLVRSFHWGVTEYHPKPQMFLKALDYDKKAERDFAVADIQEVLLVTTIKDFLRKEGYLNE